MSALALVFVLVQVRHARQEMRRSVSQGRANAFRELWTLRANNPQLAGLISRTDAALDGQLQPFIAELAANARITLDEASQMFAYQWAMWVFRAQVIPFVGELRPGERAQFDSGIRIVYQNLPAGRLWFQTYKNILDPEAVRYVEDTLAPPG